ncbi:MAG: tetratricopeptide repeat protein [Smithella sp.]|jgi:tetratricopeptide (TPR) repeat protein
MKIMNRIRFITLAVFAIIFMIMPAVQAQSPLETLNQYISDLQNNPNDNALREKIIKHVQTMKPGPVLSTEADKYEGRAEYAIKNAKNEMDFLDAAKEYDKALLLAPWVSSYYFNQAIAYEKAGKPKEAKQSFEFYLLAAPDAKDERDVRKRIAGLEYAAEKAARESSPQAIAQQEKNKEQDFIKRLDGVKYVGQSWTYDRGIVWDDEFVIRGTILVWRKRIVSVAPNIILDGTPVNVWLEMGQMQIVRREARHYLPNMNYVDDIFTISEDGKNLTDVEQAVNGRTWNFYRQ